MANPAKAYLAVQVETTSQGQLLLMLYDACLRFMKQAKVEIEKRDYAKKGILINRAMAIIHELTECLNKERGGEISTNLNSLYNFCINELVQANIKMDTEKIDNVVRIIDGIRSAYAQIIPEAEGHAPAAKTTAPPASTQQPTAEKEPSPTEQPATAQKEEPAQPSKAASDTQQQAAPKPSPFTVGQGGTPKPSMQPGMAPRPQVNAAKMRATNAYNNAGR